MLGQIVFYTLNDADKRVRGNCPVTPTRRWSWKTAAACSPWSSSRACGTTRLTFGPRCRTASPASPVGGTQRRHETQPLGP